MRIFLFVVFLGFPYFAAAQTLGERMAIVMQAIGDKQWADAETLAQQIGPAARSVVIWHKLRAGDGDFSETLTFLARNPDWPGLPLLRKRSEVSIPAGADPLLLRPYFEAQAPRTGSGALRWSELLGLDGKPQAAEAEIIRAWTNLPLSEKEEAEFLDRFPALLKDHHIDRLEMLLWAGLTTQAERMFPLVSKGSRVRSAARLALQNKTGDAAAKWAAVDPADRMRPGLAYARFVWLAETGKGSAAIALLDQASTSKVALGQPEQWASWRRSLARREMRTGSAQRAYRLASQHFLEPGSNYADLEWLAGYIALRKLNDPALALTHFRNHEAATDTPISHGRTHYWQALSHEALGNSAAATASFTKAAQHQTAFYGQLAAERIGVPMQPALLGTEVFPDWRDATFRQSSVFEAGLLLLAADELRLGTRFLTHLSESLDRSEHGQLAAMAAEFDQPYTQVQLAKRGVQYGKLLEDAYFPMHPLREQAAMGVAPELALSIARRESEFRKNARSDVGALGLMQLMPATAKAVSSDLGLGFSPQKLIDDPAYNATLGIAYLAELQQQLGTSVAFVAAGYNAGPGRPRTWSAQYGDPRTSQIDIVDWVEHIPFRETRNYVMRVSEGMAIYRAKLAGRPLPFNLRRTLIGVRPVIRPRIRPAGLTGSSSAPDAVPATE